MYPLAFFSTLNAGPSAVIKHHDIFSFTLLAFFADVQDKQCPLLDRNSTGFITTPQVGQGDDPLYIVALEAINPACNSIVNIPSPSFIG
jgi:hypothetical protein